MKNPILTTLAALSLLSSGGVLAQGVTITVPGQGRVQVGTAGSGNAVTAVPGAALVISGNRATRALRCEGGSVTISGNDNRLTLSGRCRRVILSGNGNTVTVAAVGQIIASGNGNTVSWGRALSGGQPLVQILGNGNRVMKR